jgi:rubredoxin
MTENTPELLAIGTIHEEGQTDHHFIAANFETIEKHYKKESRVGRGLSLQYATIVVKGCQSIVKYNRYSPTTGKPVPQYRALTEYTRISNEKECPVCEKSVPIEAMEGHVCEKCADKLEDHDCNNS